MPGWLFGWVGGDTVGRIAFSKAFLTLLLWWGVTVIGFWLGDANLGRPAATVTGVLAPACLFCWAMWHPTGNGLKLWVIDGIYLWLRLGMLILVGVAIWRLVHVQGRLGPWAAQAWPLASIGAVLVVLQRALAAWLRRSHQHARVAAGRLVHD